MVCAVATALSPQPRRTGRYRSKVPTALRIRELLAKLPVRRRKLVVDLLAHEIRNELKAAAQDAALDAVQHEDDGS